MDSWVYYGVRVLQPSCYNWENQYFVGLLDKVTLEYFYGGAVHFKPVWGAHVNFEFVLASCHFSSITLWPEGIKDCVIAHMLIEDINGLQYSNCLSPSTNCHRSDIFSLLFRAVDCFGRGVVTDCRCSWTTNLC